MKIKFYKYNDNYDFISDMMISENLITIKTFDSPADDSKFDKIIDNIKDYEGSLYELYDNDNNHIADGVFDTKSLHDNLMRG